MKKVSIIIPCYNAERTIDRCALSLFAQTIGMEEMELIFLNDASTDCTGEKLLAFEALYPEQIVVVNLQKNGGQGAARNIGMSYAQGEYIGFLDADDYIEPDMYETLYEAAARYHCDMAGGGYIVEQEDGGGKAYEDILPLEQPVRADNHDERRRLILAGTNTSFAARIYRREMLLSSGIQFPEGILYEDNWWQSLVNLEIRSYYICKKAFYHYVSRGDSSTKRVTQENLLQSIRLQEMLLDRYGELGALETFRTEILAKYYKSGCVMNLLAAYLEWKKIPDAVYDRMYQTVRRYGNGAFDNPYLWKADIGLLREMFAKRRCNFERNFCMEQYARLLEQGKIQEWKTVFAKGSAKKRLQEKWESYKDRCFALGLNARDMQRDNTFLAQTQALLTEAGQMGFEEDGIAFLEQMVSRTGEFEHRYRKTRPVLVYRGDATCYRVLDSFAEQMIRCLREAGIPVEEYDISQKGAEGLLELIGQTYRAVVGFQTYLFSVRLSDGRNVHDCIHAPKFHFIFDHPLWMKEHLEQGPKEYYILTHGRDYQEFVEQYFSDHVKACYLLPPAGIIPPDAPAESERSGERSIDISFVGTWYDYRERLLFIRNTKTRERYLANRFLLLMKRHPNLRAEQAFSQALSDYGLQLSREDYKAVLFDLKQVCFAIMTYYREKVIEHLLREGFELHVYGESWKNSPLVKYENMICHPAVSVEESMRVWQDSKISLNIMSWHKGGFTERIANMLLCKTAVVSDRSDYLAEHFTDGGDIVLFDLEHLDELGGRIRELLSDDRRRQAIAERGYQAALRDHTWKKRTEEFLALLKRVEEETE